MKKSKNVLVILSSPRKGNSTYAGKKFAKFLKGRKTFVDINCLDIRPCIACGKCEDNFTCNIRDDAAGLIKQVEKADTIIVASPVYFTGVPAPLKMFIDRNQVKWEEFNSTEYRVPSPEQGRYPVPGTRDSRPKLGVIILTAGHNKAKYFLPAESEIRSFFAVNGIKTKIVLKFGGMDERNALKKYAAKLKVAAKKLQKHG